MTATYSRGRFLRKSGVALAGVTAAAARPELAGAVRPAARPSVPTPLTAAAALRRLLEGNARYAALKATHPNQSGIRRHELAVGQHPFATIFGCIDSRVPPEIVFDQGLGDLFVVRTAAQVVDDAVLGSIEFGTAELKIPLIVVLGHGKCGAVAAAIEALLHRDKAPAQIQYLVDGLTPAVEQTNGKPGSHLEHAVRANARLVAQRLRAAPIIAEAVKTRAVKVVSARYDLDTGRVQLLS
jgi:carbonic anhydrase